jgi:deoxyribose-phosphate aldolase
MLGRFLDVTSLTGNETEQDIENLCHLAEHKNVAAVCVYPKWVGYASERLYYQPIGIATVLNFPDGTSKLDEVIKEGIKAIDQGATELDIVIPYHLQSIHELFGRKCVEELAPATIKFILETSELTPWNIAEFARDYMNAGANYIKTSTGKKGPATIEAVSIISKQIRDYYVDTGNKVGIKVSGGVKTFKDAMGFYHISKTYLRQSWNDLFRIGAGPEGSKNILEHC